MTSDTAYLRRSVPVLKLGRILVRRPLRPRAPAYSERMVRRSGRVVAALVGGALLGWWARLVAHSKTPPPEGRWREYAPRDEK